jgi:hypothetical protein
MEENGIGNQSITQYWSTTRGSTQAMRSWMTLAGITPVSF